MKTLARRVSENEAGEVQELQRALDEMDRRRAIQRAHNETHGITPVSIVKSMEQVRLSTHVADARTELITW